MMPAEILAGTGLVKICGLRRPEHAAAAVAAGADLLGFVFAPSKRQVSPEVAASCVAAARQAAARPVLAVGVFVDPSVDEVAAAVEVAGLDVVQLHGELFGRSAADSGRPIVRALRIVPGTPAAAVIATARQDRDRAKPPWLWFVDGYDANVHGGTGRRADWSLAATIAGEVPLLLAGGLTPENVAEAIHRVGPRGVDVSSGVERDGEKDPARMVSFVEAARTAFQGQHAGGD